MSIYSDLSRRCPTRRAVRDSQWPARTASSGVRDEGVPDDCLQRLHKRRAQIRWRIHDYDHVRHLDQGPAGSAYDAVYLCVQVAGMFDCAHEIGRYRRLCEPPPTLKTKSASRSLNRDTSSQAVKADSQPSSFVRAVTLRHCP